MAHTALQTCPTSPVWSSFRERVLSTMPACTRSLSKANQSTTDARCQEPGTCIPGRVMHHLFILTVSACGCTSSGVFWSSTPPQSPAERVYCSPHLSLTCSALQRPAPPQPGESSSVSTARLHQRARLPARSLRIQHSLWRDSEKPLRLARRDGVPVQAARDGPHEAVRLLPSRCTEHSICTPGGI